MEKLITLKTIRDEKELLRNIKANCSKAPDIAIELQQYTPDLDGYTIYKSIRMNPAIKTSTRLILPKHNMKIFIL